MLAPIPCIITENPKAGPICSTPTRSVVSMDKRKANTPEIELKTGTKVNGAILTIHLVVYCPQLGFW